MIPIKKFQFITAKISFCAISYFVSRVNRCLISCIVIFIKSVVHINVKLCSIQFIVLNEICYFNCYRICFSQGNFIFLCKQIFCNWLQWISFFKDRCCRIDEDCSNKNPHQDREYPAQISCDSLFALEVKSWRWLVVEEIRVKKEFLEFFQEWHCC